MPVTVVVPPLFKIRQGVQVDNGVAKMLQGGDNRWVEVNKGQALYLNTETYEIIRRREG